jgi:AcrR family transcriptional regulator
MRKELIKQVAYEKFAETGYNTHFSDIAKAAGIRKQTIYNYFDSKDDLFYEIISREVSDYFTEKANEIDALKGIEGSLILKTIFYSIMDYYKDLKKLRFWRWLLLIESKELFKRTQEVIQENEKIFSSRLRDVVSDLIKNEENVLPILQTYMVMIHGTLDGMLLYSDSLYLETFLENVCNTFWNGIENTYNIY